MHTLLHVLMLLGLKERAGIASVQIVVVKKKNVTVTEKI